LLFAKIPTFLFAKKPTLLFTIYNSLLKSFSADLFPHQQVNKSKDFPAMTAFEIDFGISGTFREKNFFIISTGKYKYSWS
jgi:hypothetical protein